jgi:hypothetical protein
MPAGSTILPLPTSGRAGRVHEQYATHQRDKNASLSAAPNGGGPASIAAPKEKPDFFAILDNHHKQPPPCTYTLPSSFDPAYSRSPRLSMPKAPKTARYMGDVDLYAASKGPGPGQYSRHLDRAGFAGKDRSARAKLPMERLNSHAIGLPPISARGQRW